MYNIEKLKKELETILKRIDKLQGHNSYSDQVAKSFYLGMVGGSGRNVRKLNDRKARELDRTIKNASILCELYKRRDLLKPLIESIESGEYERKKQEREALEQKIIAAKVSYWNEIKVGDLIDVGGNSPITVIKKANKSFTSQGGCKWNASEIIGKKAASLL
jgi:hypothetical protein